MEKKLVSICIPVYKKEDTIKSTIESVLGQTYEKIEIIVVDNCSEDNSWNIINSFTDSRIKKYKNSSNIGLLKNWNKCLEYVSGDYIHFLCGDDKISPDCIELKVKAIEQEEDIALVFSASDVVNESGKKLMTRRFAKKDCVVDGVKLAKKSFVSGRNIYGEPSNVLFKTALLEKTGNFSEDTLYAATEWDMWIKLSCLGKVAFISKSLMTFRISGNNATSYLTKYRCNLENDLNFINHVKTIDNLKLNKIEFFIHHILQFLYFFIRLRYVRVMYK